MLYLQNSDTTSALDSLGAHWSRICLSRTLNHGALWHIVFLRLRNILTYLLTNQHLLTYLLTDINLWTAHSPDNSFMGFVVERHVETPTAATMNGSISGDEKKNQAVVYGKAEYMWNVSDRSVAIGLLPRVGPGHPSSPLSI